VLAHDVLVDPAALTVLDRHGENGNLAGDAVREASAIGAALRGAELQKRR
jgi:hypothetical protein